MTMSEMTLITITMIFSSLAAICVARGTLLHAAVQRNNVPLAKFLLSAGWNVNRFHPNGATALHLAAYNGYAKMTATLLAYGADFRLLDAASGCPPLTSAVSAGHTRCADLFLAVGVDPDIPCISGSTSLHVVARAGNVRMVRYLLERNADVTKRNAENDTALTAALVFDEEGNGGDERKEILSSLIEYGCPIDHPERTLRRYCRFVVRFAYQTDYRKRAPHIGDYVRKGIDYYVAFSRTSANPWSAKDIEKAVRMFLKHGVFTLYKILLSYYPVFAATFSNEMESHRSVAAYEASRRGDYCRRRMRDFAYRTLTERYDSSLRGTRLATLSEDLMAVLWEKLTESVSRKLDRVADTLALVLLLDGESSWTDFEKYAPSVFHQHFPGMDVFPREERPTRRRSSPPLSCFKLRFG